MDALQHLVGATVEAIRCEEGQDEVTIRTDRGELRMYHEQDCCEWVCVEDVVGDAQSLVGHTIRVAEERTRDAHAGEVSESGLWTFYDIRTDGPDLKIRWLGRSNGYYSEGVTCTWFPAVTS